jgi:hypothetical protein
VSNAPPGGRPREPRPSLRQAWGRLRPLQQALIIVVLLSGICCAMVAVVAGFLGAWTGS